MRTIKIEAYRIGELSKEAKQKAIEWYKNNMEFDFQFISDEAYESVKEFEKIFPIDVREISWDEMYRSDWRFTESEAIGELTGKNKLFKGKYYNYESLTDTPVKHKRIESIPINTGSNKGKYGNYYHSAIILDNCCPLTGVCYDDSLLKPIYEFLEKPNNKIDFEQLLSDCLHSLAHDVSSEFEAMQEDEYIIETIEANENLQRRAKRYE